MIKIENYPNAYKEVYVILQNIDKKDYDLIPETFIKMVENNMNKDYNFELNSNEDFENQELLQETKAILAYLYLNYWGTEEEKLRIKQKFKQDILREEEKKRQSYKANNIFEKEFKKDLPHTEQQQIVESKKENVVTKLMKKIRKLFAKN